jgi:hypothetical protein
MSRIRVTIDRIMLKGIEPGTRRALVEALQGELSRVLSDPTTRAEWAHSHRTPVLRLGRMPLENGPTGGKKFGGEVARAIGRGLTR